MKIFTISNNCNYISQIKLSLIMVVTLFSYKVQIISVIPSALNTYSGKDINTKVQ